MRSVIAILVALALALALLASCGPAWKYRVWEWDASLENDVYYCYDRGGRGLASTSGGWYTGAEIKHGMFSKCALRCSEPRPPRRDRNQEACR